MIKNILGTVYGMVYGASLIVPGLSGGTFLVIFGVYDKICAAMSLDFKTIKKHFIFYVFFGVGAVLGLVAALQGITKLAESFPTPTFLFFLGLILGGIPFILRVATTTNEGERVRFKPMCILPFLLGLVLVVGIALGTPEKPVDDETGLVSQGMSPIAVGLIAVAAAVAMVLPGISGAGILLAFGAYKEFTGAVSLSNPNFSVLIPAGIGVIIGIVAGAKLIRWLLKKSKLMVYSAIIGMVAVSAVMLAVGAVLGWSFE